MFDFNYITIFTWNTFRSIIIIKQITKSKLLIYNDLYDIWQRLLVPSDYDRKNKESCQLWNVFRAIFYKLASTNCLANVLKYIS